MNAPTKPGWYWYRDGDDIECVRCVYGPDNGPHADHSNELYIMFAGEDREYRFTEPYELPGEWLGEAIPPINDDARCAARYRWLRAKNASACASIAWCVKEACAFAELDDAVDAAIAADPNAAKATRYAP